MTPYEGFAAFRLLVTLAFLVGHAGSIFAANDDHRWACRQVGNNLLCEIAKGALWGQVGLSTVQVFGAISTGIGLAINGVHGSGWAVFGGCVVLSMQTAAAATAILNTHTRNKVMGRR